MEVNSVPELGYEELVTILQEKFAHQIIKDEIFRDLLNLDIYSKDILDIVAFLRDDSRLDFQLFVDISGVDYLEYQDDSILERFAVIYIFYSFHNNLRIKIRAFISEQKAEIESISQFYQGANWPEREVYDMYGIHFRNHPDLKRILMPEDFGANPLRKDYPLQGRGERDRFPDYNLEKE